MNTSHMRTEGREYRNGKYISVWLCLQIRVEMMKQRASSLKEQEVKLGVMLAQLQMEKAKEVRSPGDAIPVDLNRRCSEQSA